LNLAEIAKCDAMAALLVNAWGACMPGVKKTSRCTGALVFASDDTRPCAYFHRMLLLVREPADLLHCSILTATNALRASL
jgi:hypothetical protein